MNIARREAYYLTSNKISDNITSQNQALNIKASIMAQLIKTTQIIILIILMVITYYNYTTLIRDVENPVIKVAESVKIQTTTLTPEQLEIEKLKKESGYCWYCTYVGNLSCEERIKFLQDHYGTKYLDGLKLVLEHGKQCRGHG